jgi:glyoxylase-like metal-dependent hydrolase (beta-lactamase superfamily II)
LEKFMQAATQKAETQKVKLSTAVTFPKELSLHIAVKRVIKGVQVVPMGMANPFLIEGDDGLTLIDAGYRGKEAIVFGAISGLGHSPGQLKHLIFTHGHPDHIGSAAAIVLETGARTYMHPLDIPMAESGGPSRPLKAAPGLLRRVLCKLLYHPNERLEPVAIDQPLTAGEILPIAGGIDVIHAPGHCAGQFAAVASGTNAVRGRCVHEPHGLR